jgi:large subunit ribosomal protein L4
MEDTKIKKTTKVVEKKVEAKKVVKTVAKPVTPAKTKAVVVKTMKNRSGLHVKNPRRVESKEANASVKVAIVDVSGASKGNMTLPAEIFGVIPNKALLAQAVRVYLANQRQGNASTQTRGEVVGSTRKIYRQKGTGRARHGAIKAPIFVGGGVAHGPHPHDFGLDFPKKNEESSTYQRFVS